MFEIVAQITAPIVAAIFTGFILLKIRTHARSASPVKLTGQEGAISPGKDTAWQTIIGGVFFMLLGLCYLIIFRDGGIILGMLIVLMGAAISGFMAPSLSSIHDVIWNKNYVEGASKIFGLTLGKTRTQIYWADIVSTGSTITGYWYIKSNDGRKIYWSYLYDGHGEFSHALTLNNPNLSLPSNS